MISTELSAVHAVVLHSNVPQAPRTTEVITALANTSATQFDRDSPVGESCSDGSMQDLDDRASPSNVYTTVDYENQAMYDSDDDIPILGLGLSESEDDLVDVESVPTPTPSPPPPAPAPVSTSPIDNATPSKGALLKTRLSAKKKARLEKAAQLKIKRKRTHAKTNPTASPPKKRKRSSGGGSGSGGGPSGSVAKKAKTAATAD